MVGILKTGFSGLLVFSIIQPIPEVQMVGAAGMVCLMLVAIASHFKVGDDVSRNGAAAVMLVLSGFTLAANYYSRNMNCYDDGIGYVPEHFRRIFGGSVAFVCLAMWFQSFMRGDYNLASYEEALLSNA